MGVYKLSNSSVKTGRTIYGSMLAGNSSWTDPDTGAMFPLQVITVGPASASSVSFTNIPNTYSHLQIRGITRCASVKEFYIQVNNDTGNNYAYHNLFGNGSSAGAGANSTISRIATLTQVGSATAANTFSPIIIDLLDYANGNKYKTFRILSGTEQNSSTCEIGLTSGLWQSTSAVTSISLFNATNTNIEPNSQFALYGVKSA